MERSRQTNSGTVTAMSAQALREAVTEACVAVAISEPAKAVARKTGLTERGVRAIREREHAPSLETAAAFGFAYPSVSTVLSHWISKMCQADPFEPETQRAFYRDYARASKWE